MPLPKILPIKLQSRHWQARSLEPLWGLRSAPLMVVRDMEPAWAPLMVPLVAPRMAL